MKYRSLKPESAWKVTFRYFLSTLPALFALEGSRLAWNAELHLFRILGSWVFIAIVFLAAQAGRPDHKAGTALIWPWPSILIVGLGFSAGVLSLTHWSTLASWVWLGAWLVLLLQLGNAFSVVTIRPLRWASYLLLAAYAGGVPVVIGQLQGRFSDEEFFVAMQAGVLGVFWLLLLVPFIYARGRSNDSKPVSGLAIRPRDVGVCLVVVSVILCIITVRSYQNSFYAPNAELYSQITPDTPFLCGKAASAPPADANQDGTAVFRRLLEAVAANPQKGPPEYGMLALGTGEERWAQSFRKSLLQEAYEQRFTQAAHSVKYIQREAALRAYYVPLVDKAFPGLFTDDDQRQLRDWFAAINRRTWTVEWVDWMYAAALGRWPLGPYENQENGAGLLSLLVVSGLEDPQLAEANRRYLEQNPRGWLTRFRNTDDAFNYQLEWITNALFQANYTGQAGTYNRKLAFDWILLQALPDSRAPQYNHPAQPSLAGIAYLAAIELKDPRYLWLADQALQVAAAIGQNIYAQPGVEHPVELTTKSPDIGSCLIYGDSGLPTRKGPLAPDKIVFRDGWTSDSSYLLLNLRFSGWHRYKATNTVALLSAQETPIVKDFLEPQTYWWLPAGRSLLRDKRVPRENLNGLLISERGIRTVLYQLTGIGSDWAQDPPWHADVVAFETGEELDWTHARITDWQGWRHDRYIYFYHNHGPIIVVDRAVGPAGSHSALVWHFYSETEPLPQKTQRVLVGDATQTMEFMLIPVDGQATNGLTFASEGKRRIKVTHRSATSGNLQAVSIFLRDEWMGAEVQLAGSTAHPTLVLTRHNAKIQVPLYRERAVQDVVAPPVSNHSQHIDP